MKSLVVILVFVCFSHLANCQYFNGVIETKRQRVDNEHAEFTFNSLYKDWGWSKEEFLTSKATKYICNDTILTISNQGQTSYNVSLEIAEKVYFYNKTEGNFYITKMGGSSVFDGINNYKKTGKSSIIAGFKSEEYYVKTETETDKYLEIAAEVYYPESVKLGGLFDLIFHDLGLITASISKSKDSIIEYKIESFTEKQCNCLSIITDIGWKKE